MISYQEAITRLEEASKVENRVVKTPETHPDHETVGKRFNGWDTKRWEATTFYCMAWDSGSGFFMRNEKYQDEVLSVSERAIGRTFHEIRS